MRRRAILLPIALLSFAGCGSGQSSSSGSSSSTRSAKAVSRPSPLFPRRPEPQIAQPKASPPTKKVIVRDQKRGSGPVAKTGDRITVDEVGVYYGSGRFESSTWKDGPIAFTLGSREALRGFQHSLQGMRVGGRREVIVPAPLTSWYAAPAERRSQIYVVDLRGIG